MANETEINACFNSLRIAIDKQLLKPGASDDDRKWHHLASAGIFLLENFLIDIHNIAEAQQCIANNIEASGWSTK